MAVDDTPIFTALITELGRERRAAEERAETLAALLADVEALHEVDRDGQCPTCGSDGPCLTLRLVHREVTLETAYAAVRDHQPIDLALAEQDTPRVPRLDDLLAAPSTGVDRFFDALLGDAAREAGGERFSA